MFQRILVLLLVCLPVLTQPATANTCSIDVVPAATLLVPYFEVDLTSASGVTTLVSIHNASAAPAVALVTLWTDWGWPSYHFHVFLTGYDVTQLNLYDVLTAAPILR